MRCLPVWIVASLLTAPFGCQHAGTPVSTTGAVPSAAPYTAPTSPQPSRPESPTPEVTIVQPEWLAFGDSITQDAFAVNMAWKDLLGAEGPVPVNAGVRGDTTINALTRIDQTLAEHPEARYVGVAFGTNDVWGRYTVDQYKSQMQNLINRIRVADKVPVLATIPYSPDTELADVPTFNAAIAELREANDLPEGPDLYSLIKANEGFLRPDGVHMTEEGSQAIQHAWAEVAAGLSW